MGRSWKAEVVADHTGEYVGNALRFATAQEAREYAQDLQSRWIAVQRFRVVDADERVNYAFTSKGLVHIQV